MERRLPNVDYRGVAGLFRDERFRRFINGTRYRTFEYEYYSMTFIFFMN